MQFTFTVHGEGARTSRRFPGCDESPRVPNGPRGGYSTLTQGASMFWSRMW